MTNQQTGREAFEALNAAAKGAGHLSFESMRQCADAWIVVTKALDDVADGWTHGLGTGDELAAAAIRALAQQGWEVGEPVAWLCDAGDGNVDATAREFVRDDYARFGRKITPLYTAAPKQQAVEVTEEMVERACKAGATFDDDGSIWPDDYDDADELRAITRAMITVALAALAGKTEVE